MTRGTALGGALAAYEGWLFAGLAIIFIGALSGMLSINRRSVVLYQVPNRIRQATAASRVPCDDRF
jgi:hypothetical protein